MSDAGKILEEMNDRSREVFRRVVEGYLQTGDPVGSRSLTREMSEKVSAATIRNVMQDLEYLGLLNSPHISAGRVPTQQGLRMFVDGLLEVGEPSVADRAAIDGNVEGDGSDVAFGYGAGIGLRLGAEQNINLELEWVGASGEQDLSHVTIGGQYLF